MRAFVIGEANPYGADPRYALYPEPENASGGRFQRLILRCTKREYLRDFQRRNLCAREWNLDEARIRAHQLRVEEIRCDPVILLGRKVVSAFRLDFLEPFQRWSNYLALPHPSGLSRAWNEPGAYDRAHKLVCGLLTDQFLKPAPEAVQ